MKPRYQYRCWWCGKFAPSGVCLGPHETFDIHTGRAHRNIEGFGRGLNYLGNQPDTKNHSSRRTYPELRRIGFMESRARRNLRGKIRAALERAS